MANPDFGNDPEQSEHNPNVSHICKHCDQEGFECDVCQGDGIGLEYSRCEECDGEGVLPVPF